MKNSKFLPRTRAAADARHVSALLPAAALTRFPHADEPLRPESVREEIPQRVRFKLRPRGAEHREVGRELVEHLPADAARRAEVAAPCRHGQPREGALSLAHRLHERGALGADARAVGRVFDVAAGVDRPVRAFQRRTHRKMR